MSNVDVAADDLQVKVCPFCGGRPLKDRSLVDGRKDGDLDAWQYFVRCNSCAAQGGWAKNPAGAVRWWNMREPVK